MSDWLQKTKYNTKIFLRTLKLINKISPNIIFVQLVSSLFKAIVPYISIYMSAMIITELCQTANIKKIMFYISVTLFGTLFAVVMQTVFGFFIKRNEKKIDSEFEIMLNQKSYNLPYSCVEKKEFHDLRKLIQLNSDTGVGGLKWTYIYMSNILTEICSITYAVIICGNLFKLLDFWQMVLLLVLMVITIVVISLYRSWAIREGSKINSVRSKANILFDFYNQKYFNDNVAAKDIRIFRQADFIDKEITDKYIVPFFHGMKDMLMASGKAECISVTLSTLLIGMIYVIIILSTNNSSNIGDVVKITGTVSKLISSCSLLTAFVYNIIINNKNIKLLFDYLDYKEELGRKNIKTDFLNKTTLKIEDVSFSYSNTDNFSLKNISFEVNRGQKVAIVGRNGSGKSTLIKLLCGLYCPTSGHIYLSNNDIHDYDYSEYGNALTCVFQDFSLLAFSVGENIAGMDIYDDNKIWEALELSGIADTVNNFSNKLEQNIFKEFDSKGVDLSGGEKQKLATARSLYKEADLIILDEPTASLDPISEEIAYKNLCGICDEKTLIFVSHRLNSCHFCDKIFVVKDGRIVQSGDHETLLKDKTGEYYELWNSQAKYYIL